MKVVDRVTVANNMSDTRTIEHFGTLIGKKPHKLGKVVTMYPQLSISMLTDALKNVYYNPGKKSDSFTPINSMCIEWDIDVNFIKKVNIVGSISGDGARGRVETIVLAERYYDKNDTFTLENKQQLFVARVPSRLAQGKWKYSVSLVGDNSKTIDTSSAAAGKTTRYRSNFHPELSDRGYTKFHSNTETHRNYISRQRASVDWSGDFAMAEDVFISQANGDKKGGVEYFKMNKKEKDCLDNFVISRENNCLFSVTNYDSAGKCKLQDDNGRDIPMGDGVIPQIERFCDKFSYSLLTSSTLNDVISSMTAKSDNSTGNTYAVICNERMYSQFGVLMQSDLRFQNPNDGSYFYSKEGGKIKVGAEYDSYSIQGNDITFMPNRQLSIEYPDHAYGIFLDTTADLQSGRPNIAMFTLSGAEMISGNLHGMGGSDGKTSGAVTTGVHGSQYHLLGYAGACVFNPYKSFILEEARV
jgi:hypothetical protein